MLICDILYNKSVVEKVVRVNIFVGYTQSLEETRVNYALFIKVVNRIAPIQTRKQCVLGYSFSSMCNLVKYF